VEAAPYVVEHRGYVAPQPEAWRCDWTEAATMVAAFEVCARRARSVPGRGHPESVSADLPGATTVGGLCGVHDDCIGPVLLVEARVASHVFSNATASTVFPWPR